MAEAGPSLSVILPTLDEAAGIQATLGDLQPLRAAGHELILVDGGSRDATLELARPLVDRALDGPRGRARQMNAGAALARGAVLWFLHADTRVPLGALAALDGAIRAGHPWGRFDLRLSGRQPLLRVVERMISLRSRLQGLATGDQGLFVERRLFESLGGYPDIPLMEDLALAKALRRHRRPVCLRPCLISSSRRWERNGVARTILLMWRLRLAYALGADPARLARHYR